MTASSNLISLAVLAALALVACGGSNQPAVSPSDLAAALCVAKVVRAAGPLSAPPPPAAALELAQKLVACVPAAPAPKPTPADAGAPASDGGR